MRVLGVVFLFFSFQVNALELCFLYPTQSYISSTAVHSEFETKNNFPLLDEINLLKYSARYTEYHQALIEHTETSNHPSLHFNLGQSFRLGIGVEVDLLQAMDHYQKAALRGESKAALNLALLLDQEFGASTDALYWFLIAFLMGETQLEQLFQNLFNQNVYFSYLRRDYPYFFSAASETTKSFEVLRSKLSSRFKNLDQIFNTRGDEYASQRISALAEQRRELNCHLKVAHYFYQMNQETWAYERLQMASEVAEEIQRNSWKVRSFIKSHRKWNEVLELLENISLFSRSWDSLPRI